MDIFGRPKVAPGEEKKETVRWSIFLSLQRAWQEPPSRILPHLSISYLYGKPIMKSYLCISLVSRVYKAKTCPIQSIQHHSKWGAISGEQIPPDVLFFKYRGKATPLFPMPFALFRKKKKDRPNERNVCGSQVYWEQYKTESTGCFSRVWDSLHLNTSLTSAYKVTADIA